MQCPRCLKNVGETPAVSRKDNATEICDECGVEEGLLDAGLVFLSDDVLARDGRIQGPQADGPSAEEQTVKKWLRGETNGGHSDGGAIVRKDPRSRFRNEPLYRSLVENFVMLLMNGFMTRETVLECLQLAEMIIVQRRAEAGRT